MSLKLTLNTHLVQGFNQIDAIGIADFSNKIKLKVNELDYSSIVPYPEKLNQFINSNFDERLPIISQDGKKTLFHPKKPSREYWK